MRRATQRGAAFSLKSQTLEIKVSGGRADESKTGRHADFPKTFEKHSKSSLTRFACKPNPGSKVSGAKIKVSGAKIKVSGAKIQVSGISRKMRHLAV